LVSFMNEHTERLNLDREEMKNRLSDLEARFNALEARLDDMAKSVEIRHADTWRLLETNHADTVKLVIEVIQSLPMTVSMSMSEVLVKLTDSIKADIADSRQEIVGKMSVTNVDPI